MPKKQASCTKCDEVFGPTEPRFFIPDSETNCSKWKQFHMCCGMIHTILDNGCDLRDKLPWVFEQVADLLGTYRTNQCLPLEADVVQIIETGIALLQLELKLIEEAAAKEPAGVLRSE